MNTNICIEFRIMGNGFNPEVVTNKINIFPTEQWRDKEKIENSLAIRQYDCWLYSTGYIETLDIEDVFKILYHKFKDKQNILADVIKANELDASIDVIFNIENNEKPAIYIENYVVQFASNLNACFDFDYYINS